jgi:hypothetical protein
VGVIPIQWRRRYHAWRSGMNNAFALQNSLVAHVSDGSLADIAAALPNIRFTPESGHHPRWSLCPLSAHRRHRTSTV